MPTCTHCKLCDVNPKLSHIHRLQICVSKWKMYPSSHLAKAMPSYPPPHNPMQPKETYQGNRETSYTRGLSQFSMLLLHQ
jgi:hypothetical protein